MNQKTYLLFKLYLMIITLFVELRNMIADFIPIPIKYDVKQPITHDIVELV